MLYLYDLRIIIYEVGRTYIEVKDDDIIRMSSAKHLLKRVGMS